MAAVAPKPVQHGCFAGQHLAHPHSTCCPRSADQLSPNTVTHLTVASLAQRRLQDPLSWAAPATRTPRCPAAFSQARLTHVTHLSVASQASMHLEAPLGWAAAATRIPWCPAPLMLDAGHLD